MMHLVVSWNYARATRPQLHERLREANARECESVA